ncbi:MAG TPA: hypothetical protein VF979_01890 [Streptosporangiaceae bacterium]
MKAPTAKMNATPTSSLARAGNDIPEPDSKNAALIAAKTTSPAMIARSGTSRMPSPAIDRHIPPDSGRAGQR